MSEHALFDALADSAARARVRARLAAFLLQHPGAHGVYGVPCVVCTYDSGPYMPGTVWRTVPLCAPCARELAHLVHSSVGTMRARLHAALDRADAAEREWDGVS